MLFLKIRVQTSIKIEWLGSNWKSEKCKINSFHFFQVKNSVKITVKAQPKQRFTLIRAEPGMNASRRWLSHVYTKISKICWYLDIWKQNNTSFIFWNRTVRFFPTRFMSMLSRPDVFVLSSSCNTNSIYKIASRYGCFKNTNDFQNTDHSTKFKKKSTLFIKSSQLLFTFSSDLEQAIQHEFWRFPRAFDKQDDRNKKWYEKGAVINCTGL